MGGIILNVRMWLITLCGIFLLGIGTLFTANTLISQRVFSDVTMPEITERLRQKYEYSLKSVVEVEAQNLAKRLKDVTDKQEQYAIIEQLTDYQRFFPNDEGYFLPTPLTAYASTCPLTSRQTARIAAASRIPMERFSSRNS